MHSLIWGYSANELYYPRTKGTSAILSKEIALMHFLSQGHSKHALSYPRTKRMWAILSKDKAHVSYLFQGHSTHVFDGSDPVNHIFSECIFSRLTDSPDHTKHFDHPDPVPWSYPSTKTILTILITFCKKIKYIRIDNMQKNFSHEICNICKIVRKICTKNRREQQFA